MSQILSRSCGGNKNEFFFQIGGNEHLFDGYDRDPSSGNIGC